MSRRVASRLAAAAMLVTSLILGGPATPAAANGAMQFPTADYCGYVYRDVRNPAHNGLDIWTASNAGGLYPTGVDPLKGFPVQLAAEGEFRSYQTLSETGQIYGLEFYHASLGVSTFYWHMAPRDGSGRTFTQQGLVVGQIYPVGTFIGYQGNLSAMVFSDQTVQPVLR